MPVPSPTQDRILAIVKEDPAATQADIARRLGITRQAVHIGMGRLRNNGRLSTGDGK